MTTHLHHNLDLGKLRRIAQLMVKYDEVVSELATLSVHEVVEKPKAARKVNPYSVTDLVTNILKDGKPRKVADIAREIKATSGHDVDTATVRGTCKYQVTRGKFCTNEAKEFGIRVTPAAPTAPAVPPPVTVTQPAQN